MVSSDLQELLAICDRIAVMSAGRIAGTFTRGEWTQDKIMAAALSGYLASGYLTPIEPEQHATNHRSNPGPSARASELRKWLADYLGHGRRAGRC